MKSFYGKHDFHLASTAFRVGYKLAVSPERHTNNSSAVLEQCESCGGNATRKWRRGKDATSIHVICENCRVDSVEEDSTTLR